MAPTTPSLSVIVLTLNEERNIADCLKSAAGADEVIVVDSGSTDRTLELAAGAGARTISHPMKDFADQRNFANSVAAGEWVLHLDADERLTPALWAEIRSAMGSNSHSGYLIPCLNVVFGAPLRHGGWYPQYHPRLQRRAAGSWLGNVHETVSLESGSMGKLHEPMIHLGHPDIHTFVIKTDLYTTMEAQRASHHGPLALVLRAIAVPAPYFLYKYVVQAGFLDGWRGLAAAMLLSYYRCLTYLKAIELNAPPPGHKT